MQTGRLNFELVNSMELKWLEDFLALHTTRNFHTAAKQRNVSQPAFSRRIQSLETWVKEPLFDRNARPASLTKAGEKTLSFGARIGAPVISSA